jgi:hypothetical protein
MESLSRPDAIRWDPQSGIEAAFHLPNPATERQPAALPRTHS